MALLCFVHPMSRPLGRLKDIVLIRIGSYRHATWTVASPAGGHDGLKGSLVSLECRDAILDRCRFGSTP